MKRERNSGIGDIISTLIIAVLFAVILLLVVFSASSYRNATSGQSENDNSRAVLSYITTAVRGSSALGREHASGGQTGEAGGAKASARRSRSRSRASRRS